MWTLGCTALFAEVGQISAGFVGGARAELSCCQREQVVAEYCHKMLPSTQRNCITNTRSELVVTTN